MLEQKYTNVLLQVVRIMFCPTAAISVLVEEWFWLYSRFLPVCNSSCSRTVIYQVEFAEVMVPGFSQESHLHSILTLLRTNLVQTCVPGQHSWEQDGFQSALFSAWHTTRDEVGSATQIWKMDNPQSLGTDLSCFHEVHWNMAWLHMAEYLSLKDVPLWFFAYRGIYTRVQSSLVYRKQAWLLKCLYM